MGISNKIGQFVGQVQDGVKSSSKSMVGLFMKVVTGFMIGLTFALIGQEIFAYGPILFMFVMILVGSLIFRVMAEWSLVGTLVFDMLAVLLALVLRMYILMAP